MPKATKLKDPPTTTPYARSSFSCEVCEMTYTDEREYRSHFYELFHRTNVMLSQTTQTPNLDCARVPNSVPNIADSFDLQIATDKQRAFKCEPKDDLDDEPADHQPTESDDELLAYLNDDDEESNGDEEVNDQTGGGASRSEEIPQGHNDLKFISIFEYAKFSSALDDTPTIGGYDAIKHLLNGIKPSDVKPELNGLKLNNLKTENDLRSNGPESNSLKTENGLESNDLKMENSPKSGSLKTANGLDLNDLQSKDLKSNGLQAENSLKSDGLKTENGIESNDLKTENDVEFLGFVRRPNDQVNGPNLKPKKETPSDLADKRRPNDPADGLNPKATNETPSGLAKTNSAQTGGQANIFYCTICNVSCLSLDILTSHLGGKKHTSLLSQALQGDQIVKKPKALIQVVVGNLQQLQKQPKKKKPAKQPHLQQPKWQLQPLQQWQPHQPQLTPQQRQPHQPQWQPEQQLLQQPQLTQQQQPERQKVGLEYIQRQIGSKAAHCTLCQCPLGGESIVMQHVQGRRHHQAVKRASALRQVG